MPLTITNLKEPTMGAFSFCDLPVDDLVAAAQADPADDSAAMAEILRRFEGQVAFTANTTVTEWHLRQDAAQGARLGLVKAVRKHTPGTAGFSSYARLYMKGAASRAIAAMTANDEIARDPSDALEAPSADRPGVIRVSTVPSGESATPFEFDVVAEVLTPAQRLVARDRYVHDLTLAEIAAGLGVSVSAVSQRLKTIHTSLLPLVIEAMAA